jgi:hypothetical protein
MNEIPLTDEQALALAGTTDPDTQFVYHTVGQATYYLDGLRQRHRVLAILKTVNALRVYKTGDLTFAVRPGRFMDGAACVDYAGSTSLALANNQTSAIYLDAAGTLQVSTTGFPDATETPHLPLATITTAAGTYAHEDIVDYRGRCLFQIPSAMAASQASALVAGEPADALHTHDTPGLFDGAVEGSKLSSAVLGLLPELHVTVGDEDAYNVRRVTVQTRDAAGGDLAGRFVVRVWIAQTDFGSPSSLTHVFSLHTGTPLQTFLTHGHYLLSTDAAGQVVFDIEATGAVSRYVMVEAAGRIVSSGEITWQA